MIRRHEPCLLVQPFSAAKEARSERASALVAEALREVCDRVTSILIGAEAAKRWLSGDVPNLAEAREAIEIILCDSRRAAHALVGGRDLVDGPLATPICRGLDGQSTETASAGRNSLGQSAVAGLQRLRRRRPLLAGIV